MGNLSLLGTFRLKKIPNVYSIWIIKDKINKKCEIFDRKTPIEIIENALEGIELTENIMGKSNKSAASDLEVAKIMLIAAAKGAWHNIAINLKYIDDEAFVTKQSRYKEIVDDL